jgi:uncharacterized protein (DUF849 family)
MKLADPSLLKHQCLIDGAWVGERVDAIRNPATGVLIGGNVRVGLEDSLYIGKGKLVASNREQVLKIRRILEELGYEIATPAEARKMLALKGGDRVGF